MTTLNEIIKIHYTQKRMGKKAKRSQFYQWNKNWKKAKREGLDMVYSTKRPYYRVIKNHGWNSSIIEEVKNGANNHVSTVQSVGSFTLEVS